MKQHWLARFFRAFFACFPGSWCAAAFLALVLIELSVPLVRRTSFLFNEGIGWDIKTALVGLIVISSAATVWLVHWYFQFFNFVRRRMKRRVGRISVRISTSALFATAFALYFASWLFFWRLGLFPGLDAIVFGSLNFEMLGRHFWQTERGSFVIVLGVVSLVTAGAFVLGWRAVNRVHSKSRSWIAGCVVVWLAFNAAWLVIDRAESTVTSPNVVPDRIEAFAQSWPSFTYEVRSRTNPVTSFVAELTSIANEELEGEIPSDALEPIRLQEPEPHPVNSVKKRSIVLITVESLRSDIVFMRHQGKAIMPTVNELARTGTFFPNCYAQSVHSDYSDPCILSSLYPLRRSRAHFYSRSDPWPKVLIYDLLKPYGYSTAIFSSQNETWSNMHVFYESPNLDVFFDSRSYDGPTYVQKGYFSRWMSETGNIAGKLDDAITVREAIKWMQSQHRSNQPFFVSLNFQTSHFPYEIPDGRKGPFTPAALDFDLSFVSYPKEKANEVRNAYFNALRYIDKQISQLVDYLELSGHRKDTIILITGDHGQAFYEIGEATHGQSPLETTTRVGLVMNCPELIARLVDTYLAQSIDITPTVAQLVGVSPHPAFQGIDLLDEQRIPHEQRLVFVHCKNPISSIDAVISGTGWKYMLNYRTQKRALYFRPTDIKEHTNLARDARKVAYRMHAVLIEWRQRQLLYHARPRYYKLFYSPREPDLATNDVSFLTKPAQGIESNP